MRHVRMLGLCLVAVFALSAITASQAMAKKEACTQYGEFCETLKEHANYEALANCPYEEAGVEVCFWGRTSYTKTDPSYFTAGKVTVNLKNPITLLGGGVYAGHDGQFDFAAAVGAPTISPVAQPSIPLGKAVNTALLSRSELERYTYFAHIAKETKTTATVEEAGPVEDLVVNLVHLLEEEHTAFIFPVKVKLSNPFVGENCYVGSDEHPIDVEFTTGEAGELHGYPGNFETAANGYISIVAEDTLVAAGFESPGVEGCGVEGGADAAIDSALGLPSATGNTAVIHGTLKNDTARAERLGLDGER